MLGGLKDHVKVIKRCRRLILIGCGTSYHAAIAVSIVVYSYAVITMTFQWFVERSYFNEELFYFIFCQLTAGMHAPT